MLTDPVYQTLHFSREITLHGNKSCRSPASVNRNLVKTPKDLLEDAPGLDFSTTQEPKDPQN